MKTIDINKINVPASYLLTQPKKHRLDSIRDYYKKYGKLDKPIVINFFNKLVDNYARYVVAKELSLNEVPCISPTEYKKHYLHKDNQKNMYIIGQFKNCDKEYTWRNKKNIDILVGDTLLVKCNNTKGCGVITVTQVFSSDDTDLLKHKTVIKKLK